MPGTGLAQIFLNNKNMNEIEYTVKIAILRVLKDIVNADNIIQNKEIEYMNQVAELLNVKDNYESEVDNMVTLQALTIIKEKLTAEQKKEFAKYMGNMIIADGDINYNEVKLYNAVCESCNIEKDFHVEDYPEYSLSGPFVNPEDLMNCMA